MLKLIFQPIVDNSIYHGLEKQEGEGEIYISGTCENGYLYFLISDNGVGMDVETVKRLNGQFNQLQHEENGKRGIGLHNVNDRIKLYYCDQYGLNVNSEVVEGAQVMIRLPGTLLEDGRFEIN